MSIIILDKSTGTLSTALPLDPQRAPIEADWVEETTPQQVKRYEWHEPVTPVEPKVITITGITGDIQHTPDFSKAACYQLTDVTVSGTIDITDQFFAMPVKNVATGEVFFFGAQVTDGTFDVVLNFVSNSQYQYTYAEANLDLPEQLYTVLPMKFDVLRKTL